MQNLYLGRPYPVITSALQAENFVYRLLFLLLLLFITSCGQENKVKLSGDATILAFGDSLTQGVGTDLAHSYPSQLQKLTGLRVINAGISGETTSQGLQRFQGLIEEHSPDLVILLEGGNDILRNQDPAIIKHNLAQMIEIAQARGIPIILIAVPEKSLFSSNAELYIQLAEDYSLVLIEDLLSDLLRQAKYKSDPIHLNRAGYQKFAEEIAKWIELENQ